MEAARDRRRTEAARAAARARARSCWSSLEPSGNAGGGDCSSTRDPAAVPRAGGGVCGGASSAGGISCGRRRRRRSGTGQEESSWVGKILERRSGSLPVVISNFRGKIGCGAGAGLGCCSSGRRGCLLQVSSETAQAVIFNLSSTKAFFSRTNQPGQYFSLFFQVKNSFIQ